MKKENINTIIFDFDGTIADTLNLCYYSLQKVFYAFDNKKFSVKQINSMFGPTEPNIINSNLINNNKKDAIELYLNIYEERHNDFVKPNQEVNNMLSLFKNRGFNLGIVTGKSKKSLHISLKYLQMDNLFDYIITGDDVIKPKPDPEGIYKVLSFFKVKNTDAIFIGDSDADILAGKDANVYTIGVQWLPTYQTSSFNVQPDEFYKGIKEFIDSFYFP